MPPGTGRRRPMWGRSARLCDPTAPGAAPGRRRLGAYWPVGAANSTAGRGLVSAPPGSDESRTRDVKAILGRRTAQTRQMLRKPLDGKILAEPVVLGDRKGFRLSGRLNVGRPLQADVFSALRAATKPSDLNSQMVVAPTGRDRTYVIQVRDATTHSRRAAVAVVTWHRRPETQGQGRCSALCPRNLVETSESFMGRLIPRR